MTSNLVLVMTIACTQLGMTPAEALTAVTVNGAHAVGLGGEVGSLEPGKRADLVVWDAPSLEYLPYHFGTNRAAAVVAAGRLL
jgi:imidazolonepropionase